MMARGDKAPPCLTAALSTVAWMLYCDHYGPSLSIWAICTATLTVFLCLALAQGRWRDRFSYVFTLSLSCGFALLTADTFLTAWEIRAPRFRMFSAVGGHALSLLGYRATSSDGSTIVWHSDGLLQIVASMEKTGVRWYILFAFAAILVTLVHNRKLGLGTCFSICGISAIAGLLRYIGVLLFYLECDSILMNEGQSALRLFVSPFGYIFSLLISGVILDRILVKRGPPQELVAMLGTRQRGASLRLSLAAALIAFIAGSFGSFVPQGVEKLGRILIDDRFCGDWEPTARVLDTEWYGDFSTYSFTSLAEWLGHYFSVDVNTRFAYTDELLAEYDVLIIKTPDRKIEDAELAAIDRFLINGGGVLLVGDHTNLLGMSSQLNSISSKFGITFRYDSVSDGLTGGFVNYVAPRLIRNTASLHVENMMFMTSCSLQISFGAEAVIVASNARRDPHDYASPSFFGNHGPHPELVHGPLVLAASTRVGRGCLMAFTDSTVWSSFAVFENGHDVLALDMIRALNRSTPSCLIALRCLSVFIAVLGVWVSVIACLRGSDVSLVLSMLLGGFWAGIILSSQLHFWVHASPQPRVPVSVVSFRWRGGECAFPPVLGANENLAADVSYDTLRVSVQRLGLVPQVHYSDSEEMLGPSTRVFVVISPVESPDTHLLERIRSYVINGGHLVIVDDRRLDGHGSASAYLRTFGDSLAFSHRHTPDGGVHRSVTIQGSFTVLSPPDGECFVARRSVGAGSITYMRDAVLFSRESMGHCFSRPWQSALVKYKTVYWLFDQVLGVVSHDRRFYGVL